MRGEPGITDLPSVRGSDEGSGDLYVLSKAVRATFVSVVADGYAHSLCPVTRTDPVTLCMTDWHSVARSNGDSDSRCARHGCRVAKVVIVRQCGQRLDRSIAEWNRQQAGPNAKRVAKRHSLMDTPGAAVPRLILASRLFAAALVRADGPIRLTAILAGVPTLLAVGLGDGERAVN
jgi:hypothetical protein